MQIVFKSFIQKQEWNSEFAACDFKCKAAQILKWFQLGQKSHSVEMLALNIPEKSSGVHFIFYTKGEFQNLGWISPENEQRYNNIEKQQ